MGRTPEQVGTELHGLEQRATDPAERWKPSLRDALRSLRIEQSTLLGVGDGEAMDSAQVGLGRFVLPHAVSQAVYEIVASDIVMASATESERALNENDTERWIAFERRHLRLPSIDSGDDGLRLWQGNTGSPMGMFPMDAIAKGIGADRERLKELLRAEGSVSQVHLARSEEWLFGIATGYHHFFKVVDPFVMPKHSAYLLDDVLRVYEIGLMQGQVSHSSAEI